MDIYVKRSDTTYGPYSEIQAREYLKQGVFAAEDLARREDASEWQPISAIIHPQPSKSVVAPPPIAIPVPSTPPPVPGQNPLCHTCGQGALIKRTKFHMSGPVVAIGFILLIPSALGILFGILMLFLTGAASSQTSASSEREIRARLVAQEIPDPIIAEVVSGKSVSDDQLVPLTYQQRAAVHDAQLSVSAQKVGAGAATVVAGGFSLLIIVASFVGSLLGWLLIMRKRVLECAQCGAIVPAS